MQNLSVTLLAPKPIELTYVAATFPAGERYIALTSSSIAFLEQDREFIGVQIEVLSASAEALMDLLLLRNAIMCCNLQVTISVRFYYLPFSRQDRVCAPGESNSLEVLQTMLKDFNLVQVLDVHNPEAYYPKSWKPLPYNYKDFIQVNGAATNLLQLQNVCFVSPDKGAIARTNKAASELLLTTREPLVFNKQRTDKGIVHELIPPTYPLTDIENFIIVDDICDGGATFVNIAKELKQLNPSATLHLVVTHGLFTKGFDVLSDFASIHVHNNPFNISRLTGPVK